MEALFVLFKFAYDGLEVRNPETKMAVEVLVVTILETINLSSLFFLDLLE
jgi:hypothetical protein